MKFKIDDKVKIISNGDTGIITAMNNGCPVLYHVHSSNSNKAYWFTGNELELVESRESGEAGEVRQFSTGAYRDKDDIKPDFEACFSPIVLERYAQYIASKRKVPLWKDRGLRPDDNWQMGIPKESYLKSRLRHIIATWKIHRGFPAFDEKGNKIDIEESLCAEIFNAQGHLFEILKEKQI